MLRARCFDVCITLNAPPPLPEFSPRTTSESVGNRAVHARKFPLERPDVWHQILIEPNAVEPSALLNSARILKIMELAQ